MSDTDPEEPLAEQAAKDLFSQAVTLIEANGAEEAITGYDQVLRRCRSGDT